MTDYDAVMIAEGVDEADRDTQIEAWQHLIDTGIVWCLQGSFGRRAKDLIGAGICHLAGTSCTEKISKESEISP